MVNFLDFGLLKKKQTSIEVTEPFEAIIPKTPIPDSLCLLLA